jgi:hypothetical protein
MTRRPLDPRKVNVAIDANALDRNGTDHDERVDRLLELRAARRGQAQWQGVGGPLRLNCAWS